MNGLERYGYSNCVFCDIIEHRPWEPANFVYEDEEVAVFHNVLGWIPVMLIAVPRGTIADGAEGRGRHYQQQDLWRNMGRLGAVAMRIGREHCQIDGVSRFRLVCNVGSLALQTQAHAHLHILGAAFEPSYPDLRATGELVHADSRLLAYRGRIESRFEARGITALMVVPREEIAQDAFFARMDEFGSGIIDLAERYLGESYRFLAEVGPHAPVQDNRAHVFLLGGGSLGHYV